MFRLSIGASDTPRTLKRLVATLLVMALVIPFVDKAFGVFLRRMTKEPPSIMPFQNINGVEALWRMRDEGINPIAFTGTSTMNTALSPSIFEHRVNALAGELVQSLNASYSGGLGIINRDIILNLLVPAGIKTIIYGVEPLALQNTPNVPIILSGYYATPLGYALSRPSKVERDLLLWLLRHSALVRYRDNVLDWIKGTRKLDDIGFPLNLIVDKGHLDLPTILNRDLVVAQSVTPFDASPELQTALIEIAQACADAGIRCIFINMPFDELAHTVITERDEAAFHAVLYRAGNLGSIPIWDFDTPACRAFFADQSFYNLNHLNTMGAEKFSTAVADLYVQQVMGQPIPLDSDGHCAQIWKPQ